MNQKNEVYLGDGLFCSINSVCELQLIAPRYFEDHFVYINEDNLMPLLKQIEDCFKLKITVEKIDK